jgi:hypothetical protein
VADRPNAAVGLNVTLILQLAPANRLAPHVVVRAKSVLFTPATTMLVMVKGPLPLLVSVTLLKLLVVPMSRVVKVSEVGDTVTAEMPVPLRLTVCGLPAALSVIVTSPVLGPSAVGVNRTLMVQLEPAARVAPQVVVREKSLALAPVITMLEMVKTALPMFLTVTELAALVVPTRRLAKAIDVRERLTAGATPVPVRATVCGLPAALSFTVSVPARAPAAVGVKVTLIAHDPPTPRVAGPTGQLPDRA